MRRGDSSTMASVFARDPKLEIPFDEADHAVQCIGLRPFCKGEAFVAGAGLNLNDRARFGAVLSGSFSPVRGSSI
jgi:hypothetical protein